MHLHNLAFGDCHPPHVDVVDAFAEVAPLHTFSFSCVVAVLSTLTFLALGLAGIIWLGPQFFPQFTLVEIAVKVYWSVFFPLQNFIMPCRRNSRQFVPLYSLRFDGDDLQSFRMSPNVI